MQFIKTINQVVAFIIELGMFAIVSYWGYQQGKTIVAKYSFAIILLIVAIALWGIFAAPNSLYRLEFSMRIIFELFLFSIASFLLYKTGHSTLAVCFGTIALTSEAIAYIFKQ